VDALLFRFAGEHILFMMNIYKLYLSVPISQFYQEVIDNVCFEAINQNL